MRKMLVVANREYNAAVRTKAFLVGLVLSPAILVAAYGLPMLLKDFSSKKEKTFAVVDRTPGESILPVLEAALEMRNNSQIFDPETGEKTDAVFVVERVEPSADTPEAILQQRYDLSERIRRQEIRGFLEIAPDVVQLDGPPERRAVRFQTNTPTQRAFPRWANEVVNAAVKDKRIQAAGLPREQVAAAQQPVALESRGLSRRNPSTGEIEDGRAVNPLAYFLLPSALIGLMFMLIFGGSTPLMQGVVEEKAQKIAEVLLGSVRPFDLMMGKLLGMVGVSVTLSVVYLTGGWLAARHYGYSEYLTPQVVAWFAFFQVLGVLLYGSLFIAIGAASTSTQETQTLLTPIMLLGMLPVFVLVNVIDEPDGNLARWISLFPLATPTIMTMRVAIPPGIALWQPVLGAVVMLVSTLFCVYAAGRIFRVGILMQGKGASFSDLARWVFQG